MQASRSVSQRTGKLIVQHSPRSTGWVVSVVALTVLHSVLAFSEDRFSIARKKKASLKVKVFLFLKVQGTSQRRLVSDYQQTDFIERKFL